MTKKQAKIEQVDWNETILHDDLEEDAQYSETSNYWKTGRIGTAYQAFIDANDIIEKSNLPEGVKKSEITKILNSRKSAFGTNFSYVPPWNGKLWRLQMVILLPLAGFHPNQTPSVWRRFSQQNQIFSSYSTHKTELI